MSHRPPGSVDLDRAAAQAVGAGRLAEHVAALDLHRAVLLEPTLVLCLKPMQMLCLEPTEMVSSEPTVCVRVAPTVFSSCCPP